LLAGLSGSHVASRAWAEKANSSSTTAVLGWRARLVLVASIAETGSAGTARTTKPAPKRSTLPRLSGDLLPRCRALFGIEPAGLVGIEFRNQLALFLPRSAEEKAWPAIPAATPAKTVPDSLAVVARSAISFSSRIVNPFLGTILLRRIALLGR
jgi:hypothetical protein